MRSVVETDHIATASNPRQQGLVSLQIPRGVI
jgi:hypothetical protein